MADPKIVDKSEIITKPGKFIIPREIENEFTPTLPLGKKLFEEKHKAKEKLKHNKESNKLFNLISSTAKKLKFHKSIQDRKCLKGFNKSNHVYFCGEDSETHRWGVSLDEEDFFKQVYALKRKKSSFAIIGVRRTNFFKLDRIYAFIRETRKQKQIILPNFSMTPFNTLKKRFYDYLNEITKISKPDKIKYIIIDKDLDKILDTISKEARDENFKENMMLRAIGPVFKDVFIGPRYILFNANARCNTDCVYCRTFSPFRGEGVREKELKEMNPELDLKTIEKVLENAKDMGTELALFVGEGEPTAYSKFGEVIDSVKKNKLQINFSTNGMLLNRFIDKLTNGTCNTVTVSMSWASEETFKKIRPGTNIKYVEIIKNNIKMLSNARKNNRSPHIILLHAINKRNYYEIPKMAILAKELGADSIWYQMTHLSPYMVKELKLSTEEMQKTRELFEKARKICKDAKINFSPFVDFELKHFDEKKGDWSKKGLLHQGCYVGWHFAYIDLNNLVSFCCGVRHIGKIKANNEFKDIWYSKAYKRYRNDGLIMHKENPVDMFGKPLYDPFCDSCDNHDQNTYMIEKIKNFKLDKFVER